MIEIITVDPAGIPLVAECHDCLWDTTCQWHRPLDEFWATSIAAWMLQHYRPNGVQYRHGRALPQHLRDEWLWKETYDPMPEEVAVNAKALLGGQNREFGCEFT